MDNLICTAVESELRDSGVYASVTSGVSMRPLFRTNRDMIILRRPEREVKKYDVVLYRLPSGRYVLHRIIRVRGDELIIRGDNTFALEHVKRSDVIAVLTEFNRKGKHVSVDNLGYRIYSRVWNLIYPARFAYHKLRRLASKLYHRLVKK